MSNKFLDIVEENTPGDDYDHKVDAKRYITNILKNAGYKAEYKTFRDEITMTLGDGRVVVLEVKNVTPAEDSEAVEDNEIDLDDLKNVDTALATANTLKAASDPQRPSRGVKKIDKSISTLGKAVAKTIDKVSNSLK